MDLPDDSSLIIPSHSTHTQRALCDTNDEDDDKHTMYGWERKSGMMRDHFAEEMTEDDVLRVLNQTKSALLEPSSSSSKNKNNAHAAEAFEQQQQVLTLPSPDDDDATPTPGEGSSSYDVWTDAKAAGVYAYQRGDFHAAAACFASAAAMLTTHHATRITRLAASTSSSDLLNVTDDKTAVVTREDDDDEQEVKEREEDEVERDVAPSPSPMDGGIAADLSALHSNRSSALLVGGSPSHAAPPKRKEERKKKPKVEMTPPPFSVLTFQSYGTFNPTDSANDVVYNGNPRGRHYTSAAGEPHDALEAAEACVTSRPAWEKAYYRRGEAHFALRLFSDAAEDFRTALELAATAGDGGIDGGAAGNGGAAGATAGAAAGAVAVTPAPHIMARLAAAEAMVEELRELDTEEVSLKKDKEEREEKAKRAGDKAAADKEIAELTAAAEERERDPRVKRLVKQVEDLFEQAKREAEEGGGQGGGEGEGGGGGGGGGGSAAAVGPPPERLLPLLQEILKVEPDFTQVSFQAALTLRRVGRAAEAVAVLRRCLQSAPSFMLGYTVFGHLLESLHGKEKEAEGVYLYAIGIYFDHPDAWVNLATLLVRAGRISDAIGLLRQAMTGGPEGKFRKPREDPSVLMLLGYLLHLRGHSAEPTSLYMMALQ